MPSSTPYTLGRPLPDAWRDRPPATVWVRRGPGLSQALVAHAANALALHPQPSASTSAFPLEAPTIEAHVGTPPKAAPQPAWERVATDARGTVWRTPEGLRWAGDGGGHVQWREDHGTAQLWVEHPRTPAGRHAVVNGLRHAFTGALARIGWTPLHAAALRPPPDASHTGGVLLVGPSGSGKSTLTAGLLQRGWQCVSDDQVVVAPSSSPRVGRLSPTLRLCPDAWTRLGLQHAAFSASASRVPLADRPPTGPTEKWSVPLTAMEDHAPARTAAWATPQHVIRIGIDEAPTSRLVPCRAARLLPTLLSQSLPPAVLPTAIATAQTQRLGALLRHADGFELTAGRDLYEAPGRLADLLSTAARSSPPHSLA